MFERSALDPPPRPRRPGARLVLAAVAGIGLVLALLLHLQRGRPSRPERRDVPREETVLLGGERGHVSLYLDPDHPETVDLLPREVRVPHAALPARIELRVYGPRGGDELASVRVGELRVAGRVEEIRAALRARATERERAGHLELLRLRGGLGWVGVTANRILMSADLPRIHALAGGETKPLELPTGLEGVRDVVRSPDEDALAWWVDASEEGLPELRFLVASGELVPGDAARLRVAVGVHPGLPERTGAEAVAEWWAAGLAPARWRADAAPRWIGARTLLLEGTLEGVRTLLREGLRKAQGGDAARAARRPEEGPGVLGRPARPEPRPASGRR